MPDVKLTDIHATAKKRFEVIQTSVYQERMLCLEDRRFCSISGAQWEGSLGDQFANKPKFEVNKILLAVIKIFNEYRNNRITVSFVAKDGSDSTELANTCAGLYRADEDDSCAEEAYDNAFEEGSTGGFGAWRLITEYENEEDEDDTQQRIRFEPIFDADSCVFFDTNSKRQDKSDAKYCFVLTSMSHDAFEEEWHESPTDWNKTISQNEFDWWGEEHVFVAEYYVKEVTKKTIHFFKPPVGEEEKFDSDQLTAELKADLKARGYKELRRKKINKNQIHKYIMCGNSMLEDCGIIAGRNIPIVPYFGKRWYVDGLERCMGHVRLAKDVSRLKNMQLSKLAEIAGKSSVEKPIFTPEQIVGHTDMWADDNIQDYPYLLTNPIIDANGQKQAAGPVAYTKPPTIPPAMAALLELTEKDIQDILGNHTQGETIQPNISGKAIELVQQSLAMQPFIYLSNFRKSVKRCGEIWLSMMKDIVVEPKRSMKTLDKQGKASKATMLVPHLDTETLEQTYENDLSKANFDVSVDLGPTSSSKRAATVRSLLNVMSLVQDPESKNIIGAMIMMNLEGEGLNEINAYYREKLIELGVVKPTDEEIEKLQQKLANQQPDPQAEYLKAAAEQATAEGAKARADTILTVKKAEETDAKTIKILAEVDKMSNGGQTGTIDPQSVS
jgi:Phage P22-like portal protein